MSSREDILARVRDRLARHVPQAESAQTPPQQAFARDAATLRRRFIERSLVLSTTVDEVAACSDVPAAVRRFLDAHALGGDAVIWPQLSDLDWAAAGVRTQARGARGDDAVGITGALCAVAETGTLLLCSSPDTPATVSLLPATHVAIVEAGAILATMEEAFARARATFATLPRALNFISGPSRTADIEQTIVLGAHGPCRVHLVIVGA